MESLPIDMTFLLVSKLDKSQDIINFKESNSTTEEHLNDLNHWNQLIRSEIGPEYVINPAQIYTKLKHRKEKVQDFMAQSDGVMKIDLSPNRDISDYQILESLVNDPIAMRYLVPSNPQLTLHSNGEWTIIMRNKFFSGIVPNPHGKMNPAMLEKILMYQSDL